MSTERLSPTEDNFPYTRRAELISQKFRGASSLEQQEELNGLEATLPPRDTEEILDSLRELRDLIRVSISDTDTTAQSPEEPNQ